MSDNGNKASLPSGSQASNPSSGSQAGESLSVSSSGSQAIVLLSGDQASAPPSGDQASVPPSGSQASIPPSGSLARTPSSGSLARSRRARCKICSDKKVIGYVTKPAYHDHFSNRYLQERSLAKGKSSFICPPCNQRHPSEKPSSNKRLKVCVSSSMLHKFWESENPDLAYEGDSTHVDWLTIDGARINH